MDAWLHLADPLSISSAWNFVSPFTLESSMDYMLPQQGVVDSYATRRPGGNNPYGSRGCRSCIPCRKRKGKVRAFETLLMSSANIRLFPTVASFATDTVIVVDPKSPKRNFTNCNWEDLPLRSDTLPLQWRWSMNIPLPPWRIFIQ